MRTPADSGHLHPILALHRPFDGAIRANSYQKKLIPPIRLGVFGEGGLFQHREDGGPDGDFGSTGQRLWVWARVGTVVGVGAGSVTGAVTGADAEPAPGQQRRHHKEEQP